MSRYIDADLLIDMLNAKADTVIDGKETFYYIAKWVDKLAKENDKIIELPCKIGKTIYGIDDEEGNLYTYKVTGFEVSKDKIEVYAKYDKYRDSVKIPKCFFGKCVFWNKKEAEKALKEREENER